MKKVTRPELGILEHAENECQETYKPAGSDRASKMILAVILYREEYSAGTWKGFDPKRVSRPASQAAVEIVVFVILGALKSEL